MVPVLKHFPGHGSVPADSHTTLPVQRRTRVRLDAIDLAPFRAAVAAGVPAVMTGHLDVRAFDPGTPSSMSRSVVTGVLRRELGFDGLVVTDSLQMAGARPGRDGGARQAVRALRAGNDVLLMPLDPAAARRGIIAAVRRGALAPARPWSAPQPARSRCCSRASRTRNGHVAAVRPDPAPRPPAPCPRPPSRSQPDACRGPLAGSTVSPSGDDDAVAAFTTAAQGAGLHGPAAATPPPRLARAEPRPKTPGAAHPLARPRAPSYRPAGDAGSDREESRLAQGTQIGFAGYGDGPVSGDVAVAVDTPYVLGSWDAPIRIATYGDTPGAMRALVAVLQGRAAAPGRLPVEVRGLPRRGCSNPQNGSTSRAVPCPRDAGQHDRGLASSPLRASRLRSCVGHDVDAALLDRQPADVRARAAPPGAASPGRAASSSTR